ncbi:MAG TPA: hypothetical protein DDW74_00955, partial [Porphyromonadaceae bacterium]|nr:hypothetical protein [Porphyromonadaceae bacterium]
GVDGKDGADGATGPQGPAGQDGDANLTITETSTAIIIVYKGVTYKISKGTGLTPDDAFLNYVYVSFGKQGGLGTITAKMSDGTPVTSPSVVDITKEPVTFTATPAEGYEVVQWLDDGETVLPFPGKVYSKALHVYQGTAFVRVEFDEIAATSIDPALIIGNWELNRLRMLEDGIWYNVMPPKYSVQFLTTNTGVANNTNNFTYTIGGLWLQQSTSYPPSIPEYAHVKIRKLTATELVYSYDDS